jgi:hypothetical protein
VTSVFHVNLVDLNGKIDFCLSFLSGFMIMI